MSISKYTSPPHPSPLLSFNAVRTWRPTWITPRGLPSLVPRPFHSTTATREGATLKNLPSHGHGFQTTGSHPKCGRRASTYDVCSHFTRGPFLSLPINSLSLILFFFFNKCIKKIKIKIYINGGELVSTFSTSPPKTSLYLLALLFCLLFLSLSFFFF